MKKMQEQMVRTLGLAFVGFAALLVAAPDWARGGLLVFAGIFGVLTYVLDANVRNWIPDHRRDSGVRDDTSCRSGVRDDTSRRSGVRDDTSRRSGVRDETSRRSGVAGDLSRRTGVADDLSRRSGDDARKAGAKSPAARRAAT